MTEKDINVQKTFEKYGIGGKFFYLLDVVPLIEVAWADGIVQDMELRLMRKFLEKHVQNINQMAGSNVLTYDDAYRFLDKFIKERPHPEVMKILRTMVVPLRLQSRNAAKNYKQKINILKFCLDIGSSCVKQYPYEERERFTEEEKTVFMEIMKTLEISPDRMI